jgi:hypothetical protein
VMRIGLASDSSGNAPLLARALAALERAGAERIFFLGARWSDLDAALPEALRIGASPALAGRMARVASRACPERVHGGAPAKAIELVGGALGYLVHDKADLTRDEIASATFLFHGAADAAALVRIGPRYFVTPGRLAQPAQGGGAPPVGSFALLELTDESVELIVFGAQGEERGRLREPVVAGAQVKVR